MLQTEITTPPDHEFQGKLFWVVDSAEKAKFFFSTILRQTRHPGFTMDLLDEYEDGGGLLVGDDQRTFVFGTREKIEGFITFKIARPASDIGTISNLEGLDGEKLTDYDNQPVSRSNLKTYDGYSAYAGIGEICKIDLVAAFYRRQGHGTIAVRLLQENFNFELIELEANGDYQSQFFVSLGFKDTGIDPENGQQLSMVWNNPKYINTSAR